MPRLVGPRARRRERLVDESRPRRMTSRRAPLQPSALAIGAPAGMKTSHGTPRARAATRQRLGVVAGAAARRRRARARVAQRGELVQRAADLERARALQALGLEHDLAAAAARSASAEGRTGVRRTTSRDAARRARRRRR